MAKPEVTVFIRARDFASKVVTKFNRNMKAVTKIGKTVAGAFIKFTGAATAAVAVLVKMGQRGAQVTAVQSAFNRVFGASVDNINKLRTASRGLVSDYELMRQANTAVALGSVDTIDEFSELLKISQTLGKALGIDLTRALESLNLGTARESKRLIDNLGIIISLEEANEKYAAAIGKSASALSDRDRKLAFRAAVQERAIALTETLGTSENRTAEAGERFAVTITNIKDGFAQWVALSPAISGFLDGLALKLRELSGEDLTIRTQSLVGVTDPRVLNARQQATKRGVAALRAEIDELEALQRDILALPGFDRRDLFVPQGESPRLAEAKEELQALLTDASNTGRRQKAFSTLDEPAVTEAPEFAASFQGDGPADFRALTARIREARAELTEAKGDLRFEDTVEGADKAKEKIDQLAASLQGLLDIAERFGGEGVLGPLGREVSDPNLRDVLRDSPFIRGGSELNRRNRVTFDARRSIEAGTEDMRRNFGEPRRSEGARDFFLRQSEADDRRRAAEDAAAAMDEAGRVTVASFGSMAEAAIRGSRNMEVSVINAFTNILRATSFGGGILGTAIGALGGIAGALFGRSKGPVPVRLAGVDDAAARKLATNGPPAPNITYIINGQELSIEEIAYELRRRSRLDAITRLPPPPPPRR